jgi:2-methylfumaryl-CoA isomerase
VDYTVNPALGIPDITGPEGHDGPVAAALPAWDLIAGNLVVASLLAAERHRLRTGRGQDVELALKDVAAATLGHLGMIADAVLNSDPRQKAGNALYGAYGQDFLCACGRRVMVIGLTDRQWRGLVKATGTDAAMRALAAQTGADLNDEGNRWRLRHAITAILEPWFATQTLAQVGPLFDAAGLTWAPFRTLKQALAEDPDLSPDNPVFSVLTQPGSGAYPVPGLPVGFSAAPRSAPAVAPALGQHTEEILGDVLRLDDGEIGRLFDAGTVASQRFARAA